MQVAESVQSGITKVVRCFDQDFSIFDSEAQADLSESDQSLKIIFVIQEQGRRADWSRAILRCEISEEITICLNSPKKLIIYSDKQLTELEHDCLLNAIAIPLLLSFQNYGFMHASAVYHNNQAILFAGNKCAGKTTIARYFVEQNYQLLSDDLSGFKFYDDAVLVYTGDRKQRLRAEAFQHYQKNLSWLESYQPQIQSRVLEDNTIDVRYLLKDQNEGYQYKGNLQYIFILQRGQQYAIEMLKQKEAYQYLLKHYWISVKKFFPQLVFSQIHLLIKSVKVCKLTMPDDLNILEQMYQDISALQNK